MKTYARQCAKALVGGVVSGLALAADAAADAEGITSGEWWRIAAAAAAVAYGVWQTDNGPEYAHKHAAE